jgi:hypothetical protein
VVVRVFKDRLKYVFSFHVEVGKTHIAPIIARAVFDAIPLDELVCVLVPPKSEIQCRDLGTDTHVVTSAETQHFKRFILSNLGGFTTTDIEDGTDVVEASLHIRARAFEEPEKAYNSVERVLAARIFARICP